MDPEESRVQALYYFKESTGVPPLQPDDWKLVREFAEFIISGLIPGEKVEDLHMGLAN